ncbi:MAG: c-type cytochrome [Woeseia sp.]
MKFKLAFLLLTLPLAALASEETLVDGSADAGKAKAITCGACHGGDGNSVNPEWPSLAGQNAKYIVEQLQAFKSGTRVNALMSAQAMMLSDEDMRNLAVYYAVQRAAAKTVADEKLVNKGEALYRAGNKETGVSACLACHGPTGVGNPAVPYPKLRGQYATYTAKQLRDYASGARKSDGSTQIMRNIAARMSESEIVAVAAYIQGLRGGVAASD